ncbi:phage tail tape measure protein [Streptomyces sp. NPDC101206]|uniref:phage tail tape measure protein n=1 Tax=Streptomyces sp. NPDC101206 TaxID=3366128 RepID=UPI00382419BF
MAKPITITLLGDLDDLSASLTEASSDVTRFADEVEDALRAATEEAERLGTEVADAGDDASREMGGFAERFGGLAAAAGLAIGAGLAAGITSALDKEKGTDLLAAQLGASPAEAKTLGQAAGAIYTSGWGESVADANESLKALWQQGLVPAGATADEMSKIGKSAMDVAAVLGEEVGPTANAVGQMLKTGMAKDADEAFDILVAGAQNGANKSEDLLDTFNEYSTQFRKLGLDGKTAMGLIQQGLQGGARDADIVADAFKEFSIRAIDGSKSTAEGFKAIGLDAEDMAAKIAKGGPSAEKALGLTLDRLRAIKDPVERSAAAVGLFGTQAEDLGEALYALNPSTAVAALGQVDGAAKKAGDTMHDNASTRLAAFWRGLKEGAVDVIGGEVLPRLEALARKFAPVGEAAADLAAKVLPVLKALADGTAETVRFVEDNKGVFLTIAGIITVILLPAIIAWGVTSVQSGIASATAWITSTATATSSSATQVLAHWAVVGGWLRAAGQAVISGAILVGQWIAGAAAAVVNGAIMVAQWVLMGTQSLIQGARMAAAWLLAMGPIPLIIAAIVGLALLIWSNWDKIKQWTSEAFTWLWEKIKQVFAWLVDLFLNFTGPGLLIKHWDTIKEKTAEAFLWVRDKAQQGLDAVIGFFRDLPGRILGYLGSMGNAARNIGAELISKLGEGLSRLSSFGQDIGSAVWRAVKDSINSLIDLLNWAIPDRLGIGPVGIDLPRNPIPKIRAMGGPAAGWTRVGERGPEEVYLPQGSHVVPNHAGTSGGGVVVNVTSQADPYAIGREVAWALRVGAR